MKHQSQKKPEYRPALNSIEYERDEHGRTFRRDPEPLLGFGTRCTVKGEEAEGCKPTPLQPPKSS